MDNKKRIARVAEEASKILKNYPHLKYGQAIEMAREVVKYEFNTRNKTS